LCYLQRANRKCQDHEQRIETRQRTVTADKIRVLIADDHVTVREGLAAMIGRQPDMLVVGEAATARVRLTCGGSIGPT